jgi:hypothetical protein
VPWGNYNAEAHRASLVRVVLRSNCGTSLSGENRASQDFEVRQSQEHLDGDHNILMIGPLGSGKRVSE